jgi:arylsulfatase A-like enzyme
VVDLPIVAAPDDERERRQIRATYYGAQREVDDQLGRLLAFLDDRGLASRTLVVMTSDHGEMGGDHWLLEKLGYWDESYHVPLVVRDPDGSADEARGLVVSEFTESVDVLPTICEWMGIEIPLQADGWSLRPFYTSGQVPQHWRDEAHFEWDFSQPSIPDLDSVLPSSHRALAVERGHNYKYVQFAADPELFPPLLFHLDEDPAQLRNRADRADSAEEGWRLAQRLLRWRMRHDDRELSGHLLTPEHGMVVTRDAWR